MDGSGSTPAAAAPAPATPYSELTREELEAQITELAGQLNAANYRWLTLIAEFDRRQGWSDGSLHSCAHWLNFKVGLNIGAAREKVRVAHALAGVPKIAAAMARGELSYSKVRALTRVATAATEDSLLMIALAFHFFGALQPFFFDRNKRTSRFMMNGILMSEGIDAVGIPAVRAQEFNSKMVDFYLTRNATEMMGFLVDCHPCVAQIRQLNPNIAAVIGEANIQYTRLNEASPR